MVADVGQRMCVQIRVLALHCVVHTKGMATMIFNLVHICPDKLINLVQVFPGRNKGTVSFYNKHDSDVLNVRTLFSSLFYGPTNFI
jgi:hypothetical protein